MCAAEEQNMDGEVSLQRSRAQMMMCPCAGTGHGWGQPTAASSAHPAPHRGSRQVAAVPASRPPKTCRRWLHLFNPLWPQTWLGLHPHNMGSSQVWGERVLSTGPSLAPVRGDWTQRHWELPIPASSFAQQQGGEWLPTAKVCTWVMG